MSERTLQATPESESSRRLLTRREFLWWSAALGASATLPLGWISVEHVRLGFVGLGSRGRRALAACSELPGVEIAALCDPSADTLRSALSGAGSAASLATGVARRLFAEPRLDAVVLAVPSSAQLELAAAACRAGKDVFLLRPLPCDPEGMREVTQEAAKHRRQVQVARATGFALQSAVAGGLVAAGGRDIEAAEVRAVFQSPARPDSGALQPELLDEIDFAHSLLAGRTVRVLQVGGPGILPGCWLDQRLQVELLDEHGSRRWLGITMIAVQGPEVRKESQVVLQGSRGTAELASSPLEAGNPNDLAAFVDAVRNRENRVGLSLSRYLMLAEVFPERPV
jgi:predicted dehydrogenase